MISYKQFVDLVNHEYDNKSFNARYGQTIMNVLYKVWPDKYREISNVEYDCFYDDGIAPKTLAKLKEEWYEPVTK